MLKEKEKSVFELPRMRITPMKLDTLQYTLQELAGSQMQFSLFQDKKGNLKVLHTDLGEEMLALFLTVFHRNICVYEFTKSALITIDKFRSGDMAEGNAMMTKAVEYMNIKNTKNQYP